MREADLLAEELGHTRAKVEELERDVRDANTRANAAERKWYFQNSLWSMVTFLFCMSVLATAGDPIFKYMTTPNKVSHCVIEHHATQKTHWYELEGVVPWGYNVEYGNFQSFDEAVKKARMIHCPLDIKPGATNAHLPELPHGRTDSPPDPRGAVALGLGQGETS